MHKHPADIHAAVTELQHAYKGLITARSLGDIGSVLDHWQTFLKRPGIVEKDWHPEKYKHRKDNISHTLPPRFVALEPFTLVLDRLSSVLKRLETAPDALTTHDAKMLKHLHQDITQAGYYLKYIMLRPGEADPSMRGRIDNHDAGDMAWRAGRELQKVNSILKEVYGEEIADLSPNAMSPTIQFTYASKHHRTPHPVDAALSAHLLGEQGVINRPHIPRFPPFFIRTYEKKLVGMWKIIAEELDKTVVSPADWEANYKAAHSKLEVLIKELSTDLATELKEKHIPSDQAQRIIAASEKRLRNDGQGLEGRIYKLFEKIQHIPAKMDIIRSWAPPDPLYQRQITCEFIDREAATMRCLVDDCVTALVKDLQALPTSQVNGNGHKTVSNTPAATAPKISYT